jgi:hypothetical protein
MPPLTRAEARARAFACPAAVWLPVSLVLHPAAGTYEVCFRDRNQLYSSRTTHTRVSSSS